MREERRGAVLVLDNGDSLHGTLPAVRTQGQALVPILRQLGFGAMTAHWDFVYGPDVLMERAAVASSRLANRVPQTARNFRMISGWAASSALVPAN